MANKKPSPSRAKKTDSATVIAAQNGKMLTKVKSDGWQNLITGLGVKGRDKRMSTEIKPWIQLQEREQEDLYAMDDISAKIVDLPVDEATKKGWKVKGLKPEQLDAIYKREKAMGFREKFKEALLNARIYGGNGLLMFNTDARLDMPLQSVKKINAISNLNRWELYAFQQDIQRDIRLPGYGEPEFYTLQPRDTTTLLSVKIHASRVIRFDGVYLPGTLKNDNGYWGDCVLAKLLDEVRDYSAASSSLAQMMDDISVGIWKIKGLADMISSDGESNIAKRMEIANLSRNVARAILLDGDGEEFDYKSRPISGVGEMMAKVEGRLVAGTPFPHTVLFGNSPSGMGGTGRHEQDNWYDYVRSYQENYLEPKLLQFYGWICEELGYNKDDLEIEFISLYQEDDSTTADRNLKQAQADQIYMDNGVLTSDEIRKNRFEGDGYSMETSVEEYAAPTPADPGTAPSPAPQDASLQAQALNGAQVTSLLEILTKVATGEIPKTSAKATIKAAFPLLTEEQIGAMIDPIQEGSQPPNPAPGPSVP